MIDAGRGAGLWPSAHGLFERSPLTMHDGDAQKSLAAVDAGTATRERLANLTTLS